MFTAANRRKFFQFQEIELQFRHTSCLSMDVLQLQEVELKFKMVPNYYSQQNECSVVVESRGPRFVRASQCKGIYARSKTRRACPPLPFFELEVMFIDSLFSLDDLWNDVRFKLYSGDNYVMSDEAASSKTVFA